MLGKGALLECLKDDRIASVLVINRQSISLEHPKLKEIICRDFFDLEPIKDELSRYGACFFCLGVSAYRMSEADYTRITFDLTLNFARTFLEQNSNSVFCYISGTGTDTTEKSRMMWANVKGRTENALLDMKFKNAYMFRPGYVHPLDGIKPKAPLYKFLLPIARLFYPILKTLFPKYATTTSVFGKSLINVAINGFDQKYLENRQINTLAETNTK